MNAHLLRAVHITQCKHGKFHATCKHGNFRILQAFDIAILYKNHKTFFRVHIHFYQYSWKLEKHEIVCLEFFQFPLVLITVYQH